MDAMSALDVKGLKEAIQNLNTLQGNVKAEIGRDALRAGLLVVNKAVKAATYTTFRRIDGVIQSGFGVRVGKELKGTVLSAVVVEYPQSLIGHSAMSRAYRRHHSASRKFSTGRARKIDLNQVAYWWRFLEFGTQQRRTARTPKSMLAKTRRQQRAISRFNAASSTGSVMARPWVRPAFQGTAQGAVDAFIATMRQRIEDSVNSMPK
jgi:HK97 gp10 family phage protein